MSEQYDNRTIIKYADDSVVVSLLRDNETSLGPLINESVCWCEESYLQVNISKTKDMLIDFRRKNHMNKDTLTVRPLSTWNAINTLGPSLMQN